MAAFDDIMNKEKKLGWYFEDYLFRISPHNLFIGGALDANPCAVEKNGITAVVSMCHCESELERQKYPIPIFKYPVEDKKPGVFEMLYYLQMFTAATKKVVELVKNGDAVLLHCAGGLSRSVIVGILAIAVLENLSADDAYVRMATLRPYHIGWLHRGLFDAIKNQVIARLCDNGAMESIK